MSCSETPQMGLFQVEEKMPEVESVGEELEQLWGKQLTKLRLPEN